MSQNLRLALWVPMVDPAAIGNIIKTVNPPTANKRVPSTFVAEAGGAGSGSPSDATPLMSGTAVPGLSVQFARGDHVHPTDTSRAPINSPAFTGNPTAATQAANNNSTRLATTAYVDAGLAALAATLVVLDGGTF